MVIENILPIGSVVQLKDIDARIMIIGYCSVTERHPNYTFDYSGFMFPIGFMGTDSVVSFDADQIEQVMAPGYKDDEFLMYVEKLNEAMASENKGNKEA